MITARLEGVAFEPRHALATFAWLSGFLARALRGVDVVFLDQVVEGGAADGQEFGGLAYVVARKEQGLVDAADFGLVASLF